MCADVKQMLHCTIKFQLWIVLDLIGNQVFLKKKKNK